MDGKWCVPSTCHSSFAANVIKAVSITKYYGNTTVQNRGNNETKFSNSSHVTHCDDAALL